MGQEIKEYSNNDVVVVWDSSKCKHAAECVKNSPKVFNPKLRPWIKLENGKTHEITSTIDKCPSGALTYRNK